METVFCCITYPDRSGYNMTGTSVFDAAANALEWVEVHRRDFGTARRFRDDEILRIGVGMVPDRGIAYESEGFDSGKRKGAMLAASRR